LTANLTAHLKEKVRLDVAGVLAPDWSLRFTHGHGCLRHLLRD
jgi:hypothetical protein